MARAARTFEPLDDQQRELALCAIAAQAGLMAARLDDPAVNARAELDSLPSEPRSWIEHALSRRRR